MSKRFTATEKWDDPWYRRLSPTYKCLWQFICDKCDNSGVWKVDFESASFFVGAAITEADAGVALEGRIRVLKDGYWLITKFVGFQFGELSSESPTHKSILKLMASHTLAIGYPKGIHTLQDKDKEKTKVKDKTLTSKTLTSPAVKAEKQIDRPPMVPSGAFELLWEQYPKKLGKEAAQRHFRAQVKTAQDWLDIQQALGKFKADNAKKFTEDKFIAHGSTWFNHRWRDWVQYEPVKIVAPARLSAYCENRPPESELPTPEFIAEQKKLARMPPIRSSVDQLHKNQVDSERLALTLQGK